MQDVACFSPIDLFHKQKAANLLSAAFIDNYESAQASPISLNSQYKYNSW
jgi:hypothetical protein